MENDLLDSISIQFNKTMDYVNSSIDYPIEYPIE